MAHKEEKLLKIPYPPSWIDHFTNFVDKMPGPWWLFYMVLALVLVLLQAAVQWQTGYYPVGTFNPFHIWFMVDISYFLALLHYLDKSTAKALKKSRPSLNINDSGYDELHYRMTNLPARKTLVISLVLAIIFPLTFFLLLGGEKTAGVLSLSTKPLSIIYLCLCLIITGSLYGSLSYQVLHQLKLISRILTKYAKINLYRLGPLYAFSGVTASLAIALTFHNFMWTVWTILPEDIDATFSSMGIILGTFYLLLAMAVFALPLWSLHRQLVKEKERRIDENGQRFRTAASSLHRGVKTGDLQNSSLLKDTLSGLEIERNILQKIPTWPWQPGTLRGLLTALMLPVAAFLIQLSLQRWLGL